MDRSNEPDTLTSPVIPGNLHTTAMAILPHRAGGAGPGTGPVPGHPLLAPTAPPELLRRHVCPGRGAFPRHPALPGNQTIRFDTAKIYDGLPELLEHWDDLDYFDISPQYSVVYHRFLEMDLSGYVAIRGQLEGPISFGLKILDENDRPLIFNDDVRPTLMDFMARRVQSQLNRLKDSTPGLHVHR